MTEPARERIIFLDIDGVLNSNKYLSDVVALCHKEGRVQQPIDHLDPAAIELLNGVVAATGAVIVLSTTWRLLFGIMECKEMLYKKGLVAKIRGMTPDLPRKHFSAPRARGDEIQAWLRSYDEDVDFVVVDDDNDAGAGHTHRFVKTRDGLTQEHCRRMVEVLLGTGTNKRKK